MKYNLSAAEMLKMLGYDQPTGREWLEKLKLEKQISLPKAYIEFMKLMVDCPLLGTSNLWIGKMEHKTSANIPCTFYDQLQEMKDDRKNRWSKRPGKYERSLYDLFQLPVEEWSRMVDNYLVIGSDYAGGMGEFGIRMEDLQKDDSPVYWHKDADSFQCGNWSMKNYPIFC